MEKILWGKRKIGVQFWSFSFEIYVVQDHMWKKEVCSLVHDRSLITVCISVCSFLSLFMVLFESIFFSVEYSLLLYLDPPLILPSAIYFFTLLPVSVAFICCNLELLLSKVKR
jgi:hypothetical protein